MENMRKVNPRMAVYSGPTFLEQILTCFSELRMAYDLMYLWSSLLKVVIIGNFIFSPSCLIKKLPQKSYSYKSKNKADKSAQL